MGTLLAIFETRILQNKHVVRTKRIFLGNIWH